MAICAGKRKSAITCNSAVYLCEECISIGCDQVEAGECSNQGFRFGTCVKCGKPRFLSASDLVRMLETTYTKEEIIR
jgi:hypothetical protein